MDDLEMYEINDVTRVGSETAVAAAAPPATPENPVDMDNLTAAFEVPRLTGVAMVKTGVLMTIFSISFLANLRTLVQMHRMRRRKSTVNLLILQLAIADLMVTFFCDMTEAIWASTLQWYAGEFMCKLIKFLQVFGLYLSTYIIVIISIDRCMAILDPLRRNLASRRVRMMIIVAWLASAIFSLPQAFIFRVLKAPFKEDFYQCVTYGAYSEMWQEQLYGGISIVLGYILPLLIMITAYLLIFYRIARKSHQLRKESESGNGCDAMTRGPLRGRLFRKAKVKSLRMTAVIVAAFIICWTPYEVILIIHLITNIETVEQRYTVWIFFFGMTNSMVNPLIYGAFNIACKGKHREPVKPLQSRLPPEHRHLSGSYTDSSVPVSVNNRPFRDRQQRPEPVVDCTSVGRKEPQGDASAHDAAK